MGKLLYYCLGKITIMRGWLKFHFQVVYKYDEEI